MKFFTQILCAGLLLAPCISSALTERQRQDKFNRESGLVNYLNAEVGDLTSASNEGLQELNEKIWRFHEFDERYLERDEMDMLFIERHLKHRKRNSAVILVGDGIAALVFLDEKTKRAKTVSTFTGRNIYRIKQIGFDRGLIVRAVADDLADPHRQSTRSPASASDPEANAMEYAEKLVRENP